MDVLGPRRLAIWPHPFASLSDHPVMQNALAPAINSKLFQKTDAGNSVLVLGVRNFRLQQKIVDSNRYFAYSTKDANATFPKIWEGRLGTVALLSPKVSWPLGGIGE